MQMEYVENSFERQFVYLEELRFKLTARRNRLLGLWAANLLGLSGDAAEAYAQEIVANVLLPNGEEAVLETLVTDLNAAGSGLDLNNVRVQMNLLLEHVTGQSRALAA